MPSNRTSAPRDVDFTTFSDRIERCLEADAGNSYAKYLDVEIRVKDWLDKFDAKLEDVEDPSLQDNDQCCRNLGRNWYYDVCRGRVSGS